MKNCQSCGLFLCLLGVFLGGCGSGERDSVDYRCSPRSGRGECAYPAMVLKGCSLSGYSALMKMGATKEPLKLLLDTGSSDMAVASADCVACQKQNVFPLYIPSEGAQVLKSNTRLSYADGSGITGFFYQDRVSMLPYWQEYPIGFIGIQVPYTANSTLDNSFFRSYGCDAQPSFNAYQGIWGLGLPLSAVNKRANFWTYFTQDGAHNGFFAVQLCDEDGLLWWDAVDDFYFKGTPEYVPMDTGSGLYRVRTQGMKLGDVWVSSDIEIDTIVDTGTNLTRVPGAVLQKMNAFLNQDINFTKYFGQNFLVQSSAVVLPEQVSRDELDRLLPVLEWHFKGEGGERAVVVKLKASEGYVLPFRDARGVLHYIPGVKEGSAEAQHILWGSSFMHKHMLIFDMPRKQFGVVEQRGCGVAYR